MSKPNRTDAATGSHRRSWRWGAMIAAFALVLPAAACKPVADPDRPYAGINSEPSGG